MVDVDDFVDRTYVSRFGTPTFGIKVHKSGVLADADALPTVSKIYYPPAPADAEIHWTRDANRSAPGVYDITLASADTDAPGQWTLGWNYQVNGVDQIYTIDYVVGPTAPAYDALPPDWQEVVEQVWLRFADLYDSPFGGPHLQTYIQTKFGRNRLAQLLPVALQRLNSASSQHDVAFALGGDDYPFSTWGGLLVQSLYIEVLKHLIRSYTEIPEAVLSTAISRFDRRDYVDRWRSVLDMEMAEFTLDLSRYRKSFMNLGYSSVLVAGGAYPNLGPEMNAGGWGAAAARGYFYFGRSH